MSPNQEDMIDCKGALKALSVLTICQSKEDTIHGVVVGPVLGKGWSYERGDVSCQGRCVLSVKGDVSCQAEDGVLL